MNIPTQEQQPIEQEQQPVGRILARRLARELSMDELEAVSGGQKKDQDHDGTGSEPWGNLDD